MRLHTNIRQGNIGMLKSVPAWLFDYKLELTAEEAELVKTYKIGERQMTTYAHGDGTDGGITIREAVAGNKGHCFKELSHLYAARDGLINGCELLRNYLLEILEIRAGGGERTVEFSLHPQQVGQAAPGASQASTSPAAL